jgi:hypothetical protein
MAYQHDGFTQIKLVLVVIKFIQIKKSSYSTQCDQEAGIGGNA